MPMAVLHVQHMSRTEERDHEANIDAGSSPKAAERRDSEVSIGMQPMPNESSRIYSDFLEKQATLFQASS
jgi:hypothetical protein